MYNQRTVFPCENYFVKGGPYRSGNGGDGRARTTVMGTKSNTVSAEYNGALMDRPAIILPSELVGQGPTAAAAATTTRCFLVNTHTEGYRDSAIGGRRN